MKFSREGDGRGRDFRRESGGENVNESRKRSMERRNEYEINSIPPSAAWRNSMHLYALAGKASFCFPVYRLFSPRSRLLPPLPPPPILSIFLAPSLSLSSLLPSVVFLNDFSHASCRTIPPCRMKQAPRLRQWTNGRRKVGGERAAPRQDIVLPYSRLVVEIATLFLSLPLFLSPGYYCIAYLIRYAF